MCCSLDSSRHQAANLTVSPEGQVFLLTKESQLVRGTLLALHYPYQVPLVFATKQLESLRELAETQRVWCDLFAYA